MSELSQDIEPIICQHCLKANSVEAKPFHRRKRKDYHLWLDPIVMKSLKYHAIPYHSMNNALSMLLWELDRYRMMDSTQRLKQQIPVTTIDDVYDKNQE